MTPAPEISAPAPKPDRSEEADLRVGRQESDERRRQAHEQDRVEEDLGPAGLVAEPGEEERADRTGDVADPVRRHRGDDRHGRVLVGEEEVGEHERGGQRVELVVHELERGAEPPGDGGPDEVADGSVRGGVAGGDGRFGF
jgi:hypothetical protein